jgi:hypothetical protein
VLAAVADEHRSREQELAAKVQAECVKKWGATPVDTYVAAARKVIAEAALAECRRRTEHPRFIDVPGFIERAISPGECQRTFHELVEREQAEAKAAIVRESNGRYS